MGSIQLIGSKLKRGHYVVDTGDVHQIKQRFDPCETFVKSKLIDNGRERMIYSYAGNYNYGVGFDDLLDEHKEIRNGVISITSNVITM